MAHGTSKPKNLSITWPFAFSGLLVLISLVYFCLGFAIHDRKPVDETMEVSGPIELKYHYEVFKYGIYLAILISIAGYIFNYYRAKKRIAAEV